jgi:hypothetical protein
MTGEGGMKGKGRRSEFLANIAAYASIVIGVCAVIYSLLGINKYGFYISRGGNPEQLEGGFLPVILLTGFGLVGYGLFELWLHRPSKGNSGSEDR